MNGRTASSGRARRKIIRARRVYSRNDSTTRMAKRSFTPLEYAPPDETPDEEYPLILTSGRVVYQYLSGNQTRRIGFLVQQCPEPYVEIHPETAARLGVADGEHVKVVSRRGEGVFPALVVKTISPDTIFIPYHWGEQLAANQLTNPALDPTIKDTLSSKPVRPA